MADLFETGLEPEFVVSELAWAEPTASGTSLRMCFADRVHGKLVAKYVAVVEVRDLARMLKVCAVALSDVDAFAWGETAMAH